MFTPFLKTVCKDYKFDSDTLATKYVKYSVNIISIIIGPTLCSPPPTVVTYRDYF